jgi:hypothetical protein
MKKKRVVFLVILVIPPVPLLRDTVFVAGLMLVEMKPLTRRSDHEPASMGLAILIQPFDQLQQCRA